MPEKSGSRLAIWLLVNGYNLPMRCLKRWMGWAIFWAWLLTACSVSDPPRDVEPAPPSPHPSATPTLTTVPTLTPLPPVLTPTVLSLPQVCSPLAGYDLEQLAGQVSNPYHPPPPGSDDPHYGVDLADFDQKDRIARSGMSVQAVLSGRVAGITAGRFPYGNLLIVETALSELDPLLVARLELPEFPPETIRPLALSCPPYPLPSDWQSRPRSLYLLYAHLKSAPTFAVGEEIKCGQVVGTIGDSGNALAPHLHLEVRLGPAGMIFAPMAHYDPSASSEEMATYCMWRVSGAFQSVDPFCLLNECSSAR